MIDDDNIFDKKQRFEIYVPSPKARINLGKPNLTEDDEGPFGYTGLSLQSDVHLFIDANKHTLFQTGQNYNGQVGGTWAQYSNADMTMSSTANSNLSADKKIVIAAGAGQGQITAKDHGGQIRLVPYNSLQLHYQVDRIQTSLFEFFHGRRKHNERGRIAKMGGVDDPFFDAGSKAAIEEQTLPGLQGGFLTMSELSLREMLPPAAGARRAAYKYGKDIDAGGDPVVLIDGLVVEKVIKGNHAATSLKYGFSAYFQRFDPYALSDASKAKNPIAKKLVAFKNFLARARRFADVLGKAAHLLTDNFISKRVFAAFGAIDHLAKSTSASFRLVEGTMGVFLPGNDRGWFASGRKNPWIDEGKSGAKARVQGVIDSDLKADWEGGQASVTGAKAKITSAAGPWDLSAQAAAQWAITLATKHPSSTHTFTLEQLAAQAQAGTPATLAVTASADCVWPALRVTLRSGTSRGIPEAQIAVWAGTVLGVPVDGAMLSSANGQITRPTRAVVGGWLANRATLEDVRQTYNDPADPSTAFVLRFGDVVSLERLDQQTSVTLVVDGTRVLVPLDSASIDATGSTDSTNPVAVLAGSDAAVQVHAAFEGALGSSAVLSPASGGGFTIKTVGEGAARAIQVLDGDASAATALGLTLGGTVNGTDPQATASVDLSRVTAAQLVQLLASLEGLDVSESSQKLVLASTAAAQLGDDSEVTASGNLADLIFGTQPKTKTETLSDLDTVKAATSGVEPAYKTLISWNHELQKLPEDTRNMTRPIREAVSDAIAALQSLEKAAEAVTEVVSSKILGFAAPPEAIGLIANDGITLGTKDRIVGAGGKGIVFIADGGSGTEDHDKFIPFIENPINVGLAFDPIDALFGSDDEDPEKPPSLGFRVYSDSVVDLWGTYGTQLLALGRGKLSAATVDGKTVTGIGIARVAGSHAAEVAGFRKVVISARNGGDKDKTGGQVDVLGQNIFIGGFNEPGVLEDFSLNPGGLGLEPLEVSKMAGAEHLADKTQTGLKKDIAALGWTKELREKHPSTNYIRIHSAKESTMLVGGFMLHMTKDDGFTLGTRTDDAKHINNKLDKTKAHLTLSDKEVLIQQKDGATMIRVREKELLIKQGKGGPTAKLFNDDVLQLSNSDNKSQLILKKGSTFLKHDASKLKLTSAGANFNAKALTFKGQSIKIG